MWGEKGLNGVYDWLEFTLANGQTNYDVRTNQVDAFSNIQLARKCVIWTTRNITCRFNRTSYPAIKIDIANSPAEFTDKLDIYNLFLTNASGSDATIRLWLLL